VVPCLKAKGGVRSLAAPASITVFQTPRPFAEANNDVVKRLIDAYRLFSDMIDAKRAEVRAALGTICKRSIRRRWMFSSPPSRAPGNIVP
jgi:hypothetical protein